MRNIKTREGFEFWDKLNALPRYAFLLSPSGKSVQKFEDQAMGSWIDVHEAQKVVDQAQEEINQFRAERDALQLRLNAADQRIDELTQRKAEPVEWGAPKTVRQLIQQLETLDQELRPLSMLRVPGDVFEDGKERTRAVHLSFSYERVDGQWLAPFKGDGEKVLAFWCRTERPATAFGFPVVLDPTLAPNEMRLVQPAPHRPEDAPIKGMIAARGGEFAIMIDEANAHYGWTFKKHPDGMWVSGRKATDAEMQAARQYARQTNQQ
ncbi:hypothetical protein [Pseudomonas corrugata]|uniref:hypothetical protein n=1 Tax=Pseudomonas corrugata TaxID=47879 RepID=UPI0006D8947F|nr:hypothetical protein [Pseudomonas corrugata]